MSLQLAAKTENRVSPSDKTGSIERFRGKTVCQPASMMRFGEATAQQGRQFYARTGMEKSTTCLHTQTPNSPDTEQEL